MEKFWHLILDGPCRGGYNMAVDEFLLSDLENRPQGPSTYLRFYEWNIPTLSLGISQKASKVVNFDFCRRQGIEVVRRITGGKAVLHHQEITYAVISNDAGLFPPKDILGTYRLIAKGLQTGLQALGIITSLAKSESVNHSSPRTGTTVSCFALANHYEILFQGRKLAGSAQRRLNHAFLQHGSILLDYDPKLWGNALQSSLTPTASIGVATLKDFLSPGITNSTIAETIASGFALTFSIRFIPFCLNEIQLERVSQLEPLKYIGE
jgi:lipoate-protein ligase A